MTRSKILVLALASLAVAQTASAQCIGGGAGGPIPATGTGTTSWPTPLPVAPLVSTLAVTVPPGATVLKSVKLLGATHTWSGDVQFVLQNPAGGLYNLLCGMPADPGADFGGDYTIVDPVQVAAGSALPWSYTAYGTPIPTGTYGQDYGGQVSGTNGITNTPIEQIPIANGTWTLYAYDWFAADVGALAGWELCFGTPTPPPPPGPSCIAGGAPAAAFPASGAVDGVWPTVLPTGELSSSAVITPPSGATLTGVKLVGFQHTWSTDVMVVLQDPAGINHMILQRDNGSNCGGCGDDFNGNYTFTSDPAALTLPACGAGVIGSGTYQQDVGSWTSGDAGIVTTSIASIPVTSGTWTLKVYDWCTAFDDGFLTSWELCFSAPTGPVTYCTAGTTTNGCTADISASGNPSVTGATPCAINVSDVEGNKSGLIFYSISGQAAATWNATSFLCVKAPTQRTPTQTSTGATGTCAGTMTLDWNAYQAANPGAVGNPWSAGDTVQVQAWFRDPPAGKSTNLSNGIELTYQP